jgi:hypothetical protein
LDGVSRGQAQTTLVVVSDVIAYMLPPLIASQAAARNHVCEVLLMLRISKSMAGMSHWQVPDHSFVYSCLTSAQPSLSRHVSRGFSAVIEHIRNCALFLE